MAETGSRTSPLIERMIQFNTQGLLLQGLVLQGLALEQPAVRWRILGYLRFMLANWPAAIRTDSVGFSVY